MADHTQGEWVGESPQEFSRRLHLPFKDLRLLVRALTHRSYINEHYEAIEDNERLEFLGDAVLDFMVGDWLYHHMPEMAEGRLTAMRAALVSNDRLAEFARQIGLGKALLLGRGEADSGGRARMTVLGSGFEALIGALYLDSGFEAVRKFVEPFLSTAAEQVLVGNQERDPKSRLQEYTQSAGLGTPVYRTVQVSGPDHQRTFEIEVVVGERAYGRGKGPSKQTATKAAAREALHHFDLEP